MSDVWHWLLIALGWLVVACGGFRAIALLRCERYARGLMVLSWVLLAGGVSLLVLLFGDDSVIGNGPHSRTWVKVLFCVALGLGSAGLLVDHFRHELLPSKDDC